MPALTNSRLGSSRSSEAEGTSVWPRLLEVGEEPSPDLRGLHQSSPFFLGVVVARSRSARAVPARQAGRARTGRRIATDRGELPDVVRAGARFHQARGRAGPATRFPSRGGPARISSPSTRAPANQPVSRSWIPSTVSASAARRDLRGRVDPGRGAGHEPQAAPHPAASWGAHAARRPVVEAVRCARHGTHQAAGLAHLLAPLAPGAPPGHVRLGRRAVQDVGGQRPS